MLGKKKKKEECQFNCTYSHITEEQMDFYIISLYRAKIRISGFKYLSTEGGCSMGSVNYVWILLVPLTFWDLVQNIQSAHLLSVMYSGDVLASFIQYFIEHLLCARTRLNVFHPLAHWVLCNVPRCNCHSWFYCFIFSFWLYYDFKDAEEIKYIAQTHMFIKEWNQN